MKLYSLLFLVGIFSCTHLPKSSLKDIQTESKANTQLTDFYLATGTRLTANYYIPELIGNIAAVRTSTSIEVSDNTVYLGNLLMWLAYEYARSGDASKAQTAMDVVNHIANVLSIPTTVPGQATPNNGYFVRDNVTFTSLTLNGTTYQVSSDANSSTPTDSQMSQDQVIHVLSGYFAWSQILKDLNPQGQIFTDLGSKIKSHADQIGIRLKAYNYIILAPDGSKVARGPDLRPLAWPAAKTISTITGNSIETYLQGIDIIDEKNISIKLSNKDLEDLFATALKGLTVGTCDIKVGKDKHELCNRFTLRLINCLYVSSEYFNTFEEYVRRMDDDGDYMAGLWVRRKLNRKIPDVYYSQLSGMPNQNFSCAVSEPLWCTDNRWIRMPSTCPTCASTPESGIDNYNAVDYLGFYALLNAPSI